MKRRDFIGCAVLGSACFAGVISNDLVSGMSSKDSQAKESYKWVILYWMPYDNDLFRSLYINKNWLWICHSKGSMSLLQKRWAGIVGLKPIIFD